MSGTPTTRLEAFSDGVFAIAITLLVLEIQVPGAAELRAAHGLWPALGHRWPSYVGYVISFLTIGIMWANHHALFEYIRHVNRRLMFANLLLLMGVSFLPFPTAVLAAYLLSDESRTAATVFYGASLIFTSATYNLVCWAAHSPNRHVDANASDEGARTLSRRYALALASYTAATAIAFVSVWASLVIHLVLALVNARPESPTRIL